MIEIALSIGLKDPVHDAKDGEKFISRQSIEDIRRQTGRCLNRSIAAFHTFPRDDA